MLLRLHIKKYDVGLLLLGHSPIVEKYIKTQNLCAIDSEYIKNW